MLSKEEARARDCCQRGSWRGSPRTWCRAQASWSCLLLREGPCGPAAALGGNALERGHGQGLSCQRCAFHAQDHYLLASLSHSTLADWGLAEGLPWASTVRERHCACPLPALVLRRQLFSVSEQSPKWKCIFLLGAPVSCVFNINSVYRLMEL